jgi:hypothetical protein
MTSFSRHEWDARTLYEDLYCARGEMENREMENRIEEQQLDLGSSCSRWPPSSE